VFFFVSWIWYNKISNKKKFKKKLPSDLTIFDTIRMNQNIIKTERNENFMIFISKILILLFFSYHSKQNYLYNIILIFFPDGTFKIVLKCGYQVFIYY